jgi:hypothetical protein
MDVQNQNVASYINEFCGFLFEPMQLSLTQTNKQTNKQTHTSPENCSASSMWGGTLTASMNLD